jgi:WD40-like Beta Propeller Repeat
MPDDPLKEQLMSYARDAAEVASQPGTEAIHRRARRHYRRLAALTVTGVLLVGGVAVGVGLQRAGSTPTVNQPQPPVTAAPPRVAPPESFVAWVHGGEGADSGELAVVSTATGEVIRSLVPQSNPSYALSPDRRWVYFRSSFQPRELHRVPLAGGRPERVTTTGGEPGMLAVSPDGSKLAWETQSGNRPALRVRDLARGTERVLPVPGPLTGPEAITRGHWAWSPDSRQLAVTVLHGIDRGYLELKTVDVATGRWRHRFNFDARHGGGSEGCATAMAWPTGSRHIVCVQTVVAGDPAAPRQTYRLVHVDPATGATIPGAVLASGRDLTLYPTDFDPSGRYLLFGLQDTHSVSTWWSRGGRPVRVKRIEIGNEAPAGVAGAYVAGQW